MITSNDVNQNTAVHEVLARQIEDAFYQEKVLRSVITLLKCEFAKYDIEILLEHGDSTTNIIEKALEEYKKAVQLETLGTTIHTGGSINIEGSDYVTTADIKAAIKMAEKATE